MSEILLYKTANQEIKLEVLIRNETIWLNQKQISELFDVKVPAISKHLKNIFSCAELDKEVVVSKMEITTQHSQETKNFYATVQNKLHYAMVGQTASEIIYDRVDSQKQNMGLTSWKNSPKGKIRKTDVSIAKNYLEFDNLILELEK